MSDKQYEAFSPSSLANFLPFSSDLPEITTRAPSLMNSLAVSAPIPLVPPVINATFPFNLSILLISIYTFVSFIYKL